MQGALPSSPIPITAVDNAGGVVGTQVYLYPTGELRLSPTSGRSLTPASPLLLSPGMIYRVGFHRVRGKGANGVAEAFVAAGGCARRCAAHRWPAP